MGEIAKTLVSLSGPDAVHGVIPEALLRGERDDCNGEKAAGELQQENGNAMKTPMQVKSVIDESVYGRISVVEVRTRSVERPRGPSLSRVSGPFFHS